MTEDPIWNEMPSTLRVNSAPLTTDQILNAEALRLTVAYYANMTRYDAYSKVIVSFTPSDSDFRQRFHFFKKLLKTGE